MISRFFTAVAGVNISPVIDLSFITIGCWLDLRPAEPARFQFLCLRAANLLVCGSILGFLLIWAAVGSAGGFLGLFGGRCGIGAVRS